MNHQGTKTPREPISVEDDRVATAIVDSSFAVHKELGPGLLEHVYETCLAYELRSRGFVVESQVLVPVRYQGIKLDAGLRLDLLVNDSVIVELKAVEDLASVHTAQVLTYLKLTGKRIGLLINFNVPLIRNGIRRIAL
jgi:GxxExxY protein